MVQLHKRFSDEQVIFLLQACRHQFLLLLILHKIDPVIVCIKS